MTSLWFDQLLLPEGWARRTRLMCADGRIASVARNVDPLPDDSRHSIGLPGMPNLHSHAFQRAMAGLAETAGFDGHDSFWTWRNRMYDLVDKLTPDHLAAVAAMAYVEMMEAGFTRVGEFHYLHHRPDGGPYDSPAVMAQALASAALDTGIAMSLLPVFYAHADFGGVPATPAQRRFVNDLDSYGRLLENSRTAVAGLDGAVVGIAPHSLRAVTPVELSMLIALAPTGPIHIHIAEQIPEVDACLRWVGLRPLAWLLEHQPVDHRWCLVHATHADDQELAGMARSGAVVGLCPITEANLGDGLFPAEKWRALGGAFGIGSDSNIRIDLSEELRLLEYGQRLIHRRRNILADRGASTGGTLFKAALAGGARALGASPAALEPGAPADIVSLYADAADNADDLALDCWLFARGGKAVEGVWRAGRQYVVDGRHIAREHVMERYACAMAQLLAD